jgi:hypothetical protein
MSTYASTLTAGGAARVNFLNQCVINGYTDYVFEYLVMDYRSSPSKKKAMALYDVFILDSPYQVNCNELLGPNARIHQIIAHYKTSSQMNVFQKIALAGLRGADKEIFDHFLPAIFRQEDINAMRSMGTGAVDASKLSGAKKSMAQSWRATRAKLLGAGFACIACT